MVQLLQKLSIRATNGPDKLLKVVKGPVTRHLPPDAQRVGFSHSAPSVQPMQASRPGLPAGRSRACLGCAAPQRALRLGALAGLPGAPGTSGLDRTPLNVATNLLP